MVLMTAMTDHDAVPLETTRDIIGQDWQSVVLGDLLFPTEKKKLEKKNWEKKNEKKKLDTTSDPFHGKHTQRPGIVDIRRRNARIHDRPPRDGPIMSHLWPSSSDTCCRKESNEPFASTDVSCGMGPQMALRS